MKQHQFPAEFDKLTSEQLDQVHLWLDEFSYRVTREKLQGQFGIKITQSKLHRYNQKRELADQICAEEEFQVDMKQWYDLINGNPVPYDQATLKLLSKKVFEYLLNPANKVTATSLTMLHRLATYETTLDITLRRLSLAERKSGITPKTSKAGATTTSNPPSASPTVPSPSPTTAKWAANTASGPDLILASPLDSILTPLPASAAPPSPALVTQILAQMPKDIGKTKFAMAA